VRPIRSADDLVREGIWESDEELDAFLVDLYALRHSDLSAQPIELLHPRCSRVTTADPA
jgi:hypothetical protein